MKSVPDFFYPCRDSGWLVSHQSGIGGVENLERTWLDAIHRIADVAHAGKHIRLADFKVSLSFDAEDKKYTMTLIGWGLHYMYFDLTAAEIAEMREFTRPENLDRTEIEEDERCDLMVRDDDPMEEQYP